MGLNQSWKYPCTQRVRCGRPSDPIRLPALAWGGTLLVVAGTVGVVADGKRKDLGEMAKMGQFMSSLPPAHLADRRFECPFHRPAVSTNAPPDRRVSQAKFSAPAFQRLFFTTKGDPLQPMTIHCLDTRRGPTAVVRRVIAVGVLAIERVSSRWPRSHVGIEVQKGISPPLADVNSLSPVNPVVLGARVIAPALHLNPCPIFRWPSRVRPPGKPVPCFQLQTKASAGAGFAIQHLNRIKKFLSATVTFALQKLLSIFRMAAYCEHLQPTVGLPNDWRPVPSHVLPPFGSYYRHTIGMSSTRRQHSGR